MHVIMRRRLNEFVENHPASYNALEHWYRIKKRADIGTFAELRALFPSADLVGQMEVVGLLIEAYEDKNVPELVSRTV